MRSSSRYPEDNSVWILDYYKKGVLKRLTILKLNSTYINLIKFFRLTFLLSELSFVGQPIYFQSENFEINTSETFVTQEDAVITFNSVFF